MTSAVRLVAECDEGKGALTNFRLPLGKPFALLEATLRS